MSTLAQHMEAARVFLGDLADSPPKLPCEPELLPQLFNATRENSVISTAALAALIERSQKLTSRVLSLANSACYALESTITSLHRAVSVLGINEVRALVLTAAASSAFEGARFPKDFDHGSLWKHQLRTAALAKALAGVLRDNFVLAGAPSGASVSPGGTGQGGNVCSAGLDPDEAYVAGLLHDIGKEILAAKRPDLWEAIDAVRRAEGLSFAEAENAYWGMDHGMFGARVLHSWRLPLLLTDTIGWHHAPSFAPSCGAEAGLLAAADKVAHEGLDATGALSDSALALLPADADPALLATAAAKAMAVEKLDLLAEMR